MKTCIKLLKSAYELLFPTISTKILTIIYIGLIISMYIGGWFLI